MSTSDTQRHSAQDQEAERDSRQDDEARHWWRCQCPDWLQSAPDRCWTAAQTCLKATLRGLTIAVVYLIGSIFWFLSNERALKLVCLLLLLIYLVGAAHSFMAPAYVPKLHVISAWPHSSALQMGYATFSLAMALFGFLAAGRYRSPTTLRIFAALLLVHTIFLGASFFSGVPQEIELANRNEIDVKLNGSLPRYQPNSNETSDWDQIQWWFDCCGINGHSDWAANKNLDGRAPGSCCNYDTNQTSCAAVYATKRGCKRVFESWQEWSSRLYYPYFVLATALQIMALTIASKTELKQQRNRFLVEVMNFEEPRLLHLQHSWWTSRAARRS